MRCRTHANTGIGREDCTANTGRTPITLQHLFQTLVHIGAQQAPQAGSQVMPGLALLPAAASAQGST